MFREYKISIDLPEVVGDETIACAAIISDRLYHALLEIKSSMGVRGSGKFSFALDVTSMRDASYVGDN